MKLNDIKLKHHFSYFMCRYEISLLLLENALQVTLNSHKHEQSNLQYVILGNHLTVLL